MSRNPEYQFIDTDTDKLVSLLVTGYEKITSKTLQPGSPDRLFVQWVANVILQERALNNYTGNQNIPSRAEGQNLDALGELFYDEERPAAQAAVSTERFYISEAQTRTVLVPAGTRVTDTSGTLIWETTSDAYIAIGDTYVDTAIRCQTVGTAGNGYAIGQLSTIVDVYDYYTACSNVTESDGGSDIADDEEYYELMRMSMDGYSTCGALGGYVYHAKKVSTEIEDVVPNSPSPGVVYIYTLMNTGKAAGDEIKKLVLEACGEETARAFTDYVHTGDPEEVSYDIDFTYYIPSESTMSSSDIADAVRSAVDTYIAWQSAKLGRDINPSKLYNLLMGTGIKRVELRKPVFTKLRDGKLVLGRKYEFENTVPQLAQVSDNVSIVNGGFEDE